MRDCSEKVKGELNGLPFEADFGLSNFDNPIIDLVFQGRSRCEVDHVVLPDTGCE